jgi:hypothetical protein
LSGLRKKAPQRRGSGRNPPGTREKWATVRFPRLKTLLHHLIFPNHMPEDVSFFKRLTCQLQIPPWGPIWVYPAFLADEVAFYHGCKSCWPPAVAESRSCSSRISSTVAACGVVTTPTPSYRSAGCKFTVLECGMDRPLSQAALRTNLQHQKHRATHSEAIFQPCSQPHLVSAERLHAHAVLGPKTGNLPRCWDQTAPPVSERRLTAGRWTASTWEIYLELHRKRVSPEEWVAHR